MTHNLGEVICQYRQGKGMTQEEFASRLGVTPQAVSKWERGNGLPDVTLIEGICSVLGISADTLLGITEKVVENGNPVDDIEIKTNLIAEPIVIEFSSTLIPQISEGISTDAVQQNRKRLARKNGILLPIVRFRDNVTLKDNEYRVLVYENEVIKGSADLADGLFYQNLIEKTADYCCEHYSEIINKHIVKIMIDNLKSLYPGVADGVIPEKISYIQVEQKLKEKLQAGESIKNLIQIVEELEQDSV